MPEFIEIRLEEIVDFNASKTNNSQFTKSYINKHQGDIPVYGASLESESATYGYVEDNLPQVKYFNDCLTWNIDGSTAIHFRKGRFSLSEKVIPLVLYDDIGAFVDLNYLKYAIVFSPDFSAFSFSQKAGKGKIKKLKVLFPVKDGQYDIEEQQRLSGIYGEITNQKIILLNKLYEIQEVLVQIDTEPGIIYEEVPLNNIVTHQNGNASYTKSWCQEHKGINPLYSANNNAPIAFIDSADFSGKYLTYSKNGCAGYITLLDGDFSINGDRCVMTINENYDDSIDLLYLKYFLQPIFRRNKKGRIGAFGKNEFTKLNSTMIKKLNIRIPIPLAQDGTYDVQKQKEIADKYQQIDEIKQGIIDLINHLIAINVIPNIS